MINTFKMGWSR